jgi:hypothetical protein
MIKFYEKVLKEIPENSWFGEYIEKIRPGQVYTVDRFPLLVKNGGKYSQLEVFFDGIGKATFSKKVFEKEEEKFINCIHKIWVYNDVYADCSYFDVNMDTIKKTINKDEFSIFEKILDKMSKSERYVNIDNLKHLDVLLKLCFRERIYMPIIFMDYKIILWSNGLMCPLYFDDINIKDTINEICKSEGLFLRRH